MCQDTFFLVSHKMFPPLMVTNNLSLGPKKFYSVYFVDIEKFSFQIKINGPDLGEMFV